jgi:hypothetical protein
LMRRLFHLHETKTTTLKPKCLLQIESDGARKHENTERISVRVLVAWRT